MVREEEMGTVSADEHVVGIETLGFFWWEWKEEHTLHDPPLGEESTRAFRD